MSNNTLFIFEFVTGGGFNKEDIPISLFCEGFSMLKSIIEDFKKLKFKILTLIDYRISFLSDYLKADDIKQISKNDVFFVNFKNAVEKSEYCFIIAPEFSNILYNLTKIVKESQKTLLSVDLSAIALSTNKYKTYKFFKKYQIATPSTYHIPKKKEGYEKDFIIEKFRDLRCPIVIKQLDGAGADSIFYFESEKQIKSFFLQSDQKLERHKHYLLQEYVEGDDLSVSLIGRGGHSPVFLSVNFQNINLKRPNKGSKYFGGYTPVKNYEEIKKKIRSLIDKLDLSKFSGYYGIDFIRRKDGKIYLIEINPRLTTSYLGIRNIIDFNPAKLILDSKRQSSQKLHINNIHYNNKSSFIRLDLEYVGDKTRKYLYKNIIPKLNKRIPEFMTPPISLKKKSEKEISKKNYSCFIVTKERNRKYFEVNFKKITQILEKYHFRVI